MSEAAEAIRVYSRRGCHLCEQLVDELLPLARGRVTVDVVDIDSRPEWRSAYDTRVPVVEFDGRVVCEYSLDREAVAKLLDGLAS